MRYLDLAFSLLSLSLLAWAQSADMSFDDTFLYDDTKNLQGIQIFPSDNAWSTSVATDTSKRYNSTLHSSAASGSRFVLFFKGDSVYWYGDKGPGGGAAYVSFDAQKLETVNTTAPTAAYQQQLWSKTGLGPGDHQMVVSRVDDQAGPITFDYLRVVSSSGSVVPLAAGPGSSVVPTGSKVVDNTGLNMINYDGGWELIQAASPISGAEGFFYMNSVHRTTKPGATLTFKFTGSGVWYFSDIDSTHGYVKISLDGGPAEDVSGYSDSHLAQRVIWSKNNIVYGEHTVTIVHSGTPTQYATLDYFMYLPTVGNSSSNPTSGSSDTPPNSAPSGLSISWLVETLGLLSGLMFVGTIL